VSYLRWAWSWFNRNRRVEYRDLPWPARTMSVFALVVVAAAGSWFMPGMHDFSIFPGTVLFFVSFGATMILGFAAHDLVAEAFRRRGRASA
jgi:hypothetical protein